jgi:hypothetical protein
MSGPVMNFNPKCLFELQLRITANGDELMGPSASASDGAKSLILLWNCRNVVVQNLVK